MDGSSSNDRPGPQTSRTPRNVQARLKSVNDYFVGALSKLTRTAEGIDQNLPKADQGEPAQGTHQRPFSVLVLPSPATPLQVLSGTFGTLVELFAVSGVVILLVVFFLVRREDLRDRIIRLMGKGQLTVTTQVLEDAAMRVSRYLSVLYIINAMYGIAVGIGLYAIVCILCLAARDQADGIAGMMLAQLLATAGCLVQSVSAMQAATELVNLVERCQADVVCISATPPAAVMHARHMGKDLRSRFPQPHLIVGLWNAQFDLTKAKVRIGVGDRTHVVATLAEAREQVRLLIQPLLPPPPEKQPQP